MIHLSYLGIIKFSLNTQKSRFQPLFNICHKAQIQCRDSFKNITILGMANIFLKNLKRGWGLFRKVLQNPPFKLFRFTVGLSLLKKLPLAQASTI